ncbi:MAG: glycosyltransferase family 39 protein [Solirubrobacteraceae bacterium]
MSTAVALPAAAGHARTAERTSVLARLAAVAVVALAAALRLTAIGATPIDPFYAGAVRSMGLSWHNLLVGAYDPAARLAIDKAPVDLWLQVASTHLLGFTPTAMLLPAALAGTVAVAALYDLLNTLAGRGAALAGALALAVLPMAILTSRSDTMDSVMAALVVLAWAVAARGLRGGQPAHVVVAGALLGLAFEVKLFEALIPALPLAALWWWGADGTRAQRTRALLAAGAVGAVVGLAWLLAISVLVPAGQRPWAFGSTNGSAWNSVFVYDGWNRLVGTTRIHSAGAHPGSVPAGPGPLRLLFAQVHLGARVGFALVVAWLALAGAVAAGHWSRLDRAGRGGAAALGLWLALGTVLFSAQHDLRPRYLEALDPAVAACAGLGLVLCARAVRERFGGPLTRAGMVAVACALAIFPSVVSARVIVTHAQDSGTPGALAPARLTALSAYLRAHQGAAPDEAAFLPVAEAGAVIARDARPVVMLSALGHPLVGTAQLRGLVAAGRVHTVVLGRARTPEAAWVRAHGADVSAVAGQTRGTVYGF